MSFQKITYERAKVAIDQRDLRRLKQLIRHPVGDDKGQRRAWLHDLVHQAARVGTLDAVVHLASLGGLRKRSLLASGWAVAVEHAHLDVAAGLEATPGFPFDQRFRKACQERKWGAVRHLLDGGLGPTENDVRILFEKLGAEHVSNTSYDPERLRRLLPLGQQAPNEVLPQVAVVAMRVGDEEMFTWTLKRVPEEILIQALGSLIHETRHHGRYDWAKRLDGRTSRGLTSKQWAENILCQAVNSGQLGFVEDALNDQPGTLHHLQAGGGTTLAMGTQLVKRQGEDVSGWGLIVRTRLLHRLFPAQRLDALKTHMAYLSADQREPMLTQLALMAPDPVRQRWFEREPITFARAIATWRAAQSHADLPEGRRPRQRV